MHSLSTTAYLAQIAPQRSTQYAALASDLAPVELALSPLGPFIKTITPRVLGEQSYLQLELTQPLDTQTVMILGSLAMTTAYFALHEKIGDVRGPFLHPMETGFIPSQPVELISTRRYRGKTNELFTHWLCNIAKFSSDFSAAPWETLTLMDPLAGGGTTLFTGLVLGAQTVAGIEQDAKSGKPTATFLKQFADEFQVPVRLKEERLKKLGRRWTVSLGQLPSQHSARSQPDGHHLSKPEAEPPKGEGRRDRNSADRQSFIWAQGDAAQSRELLPALKPHLLVTDLPYGIQHQGQLISLLETCLPIWSAMLRRGGAMALAWDATRFPAEKMYALLEDATDLQVLREPPYDALEHRVDRVIKRRNVVVLRG